MPETGIKATAERQRSVRTARSLMLSRLCIVTADQLHEFLRMHRMAVRSHDILLGHRALVATIGDPVSFVRDLRYTARV